MMDRDEGKHDGRRAEARALGWLAGAWLAGFGSLALASPPSDLLTAGAVILSLPTAIGVVLAGQSRRWWG